MRTLFLIFFLSSFSLASGPQYGPRYDSERTNMEFQNVYNDIRNPSINVGKASTMTITNLIVSSSVTLPAPYVITGWTSYTPTIAGAGTVSQLSANYMQVGKMLFIEAAWKNGTVDGNNASITIPSGFLINTSLFTTGSIPHLGLAISPHTGNNVASSIMSAAFSDASTTGTVFFCLQSTSASAFAKQAGNAIWTTSDYVGVNIMVPIQ